MEQLSRLTVTGKTVFLRTEFNVALDAEFRVVDDSRIKSSLPTIEWLCQNCARVVICSHLGRPWGEYDPSKSLKHIVSTLADSLGRPILFAADCVGEPRREEQAKLGPGEVLLLENVRFHKEENDNDEAFAQALAEGMDVYVNDAFGNSHRPHASMIGVPKYVSHKAPGCLLARELEAINRFLEGTSHPSVAIIGGAKVAGKDGKIHVIRNLLGIMDTVCVVGKIAYYFLQAQGMAVGRTITADLRGIDAPGSEVQESVAECTAVLEAAERSGKRIILPVHSLAILPGSDESVTISYDRDTFPESASALDIGPRSREVAADLVKEASAVVWNGPAGYFEDSRFRGGTLAIADAVRTSSARVLVGGGDTVAALSGDAGFSDDRVHVCTGGGAMLAMLMGRELPAVRALTD